MSENWLSFIAERDFPEEGKATGKLGGWHVLVARTDSGFHAVNDRCTHQAALISTGRVRRGAIMCPLHGARFDMASGRCIGGAYRDLRTFAVRVVDGMIEVAVPDEPPGMEELPVAG
ncbi:MAG: Rieske (2Fe-2S) protein [Sphingomonadales bacterium]|nr:Rieske (2Fe-2S) protein [Sphingomonadales bacterium]